VFNKMKYQLAPRDKEGGTLYRQEVDDGMDN
jgi:hypothetical protein